LQDANHRTADQNACRLTPKITKDKVEENWLPHDRDANQ
jgi:hypothetical protein